MGVARGARRSGHRRRAPAGGPGAGLARVPRLRGAGAAGGRRPPPRAVTPPGRRPGDHARRRRICCCRSSPWRCCWCRSCPGSPTAGRRCRCWPARRSGSSGRWSAARCCGSPRRTRWPCAAGSTARSLTTLTVAVGIATAAAAGVGAWRLTHTVLFPSGDEPHYLVIAQSLWRDGDLAIENNHTRGDYTEYFGRQLDPHYIARGQDGAIYSIHPIGMPLLITPVMAVGGYPLVVAFFILMAATAAAVAWRWTVATTGAPRPGDARLGRDRLLGAVPGQQLHHLSRGAGGAGRRAVPAARAAADARRPAVARLGRRPARGDAAVAEHEVRADVGGDRRGGGGATLVADSPEPSPFDLGRRRRAAWCCRTRSAWRRGSPSSTPTGARRGRRRRTERMTQTEVGEHAVRRPGPALRSGVRAAGLRAGLRAGRLRLLDDGPAARSPAAPRARDRPHRRRPAVHGGRVPHLVGRIGGAGASGGLGAAGAHAADGRADGIGAGLRDRGARRSTCSSGPASSSRSSSSAPRRGCSSTTAATAPRRCSNGCRRDGRCGRCSRPSSRTRPARHCSRARSGSRAVAAWIVAAHAVADLGARPGVAARDGHRRGDARRRGGRARPLAGPGTAVAGHRLARPSPSRRTRLVRSGHRPYALQYRPIRLSSARRGRTDAGGRCHAGTAARAAATARAAQRPLFTAGRALPGRGALGGARSAAGRSPGR